MDGAPKIFLYIMYIDVYITSRAKKIRLIKNLFTLEYNNAKKVSWQRWIVGSVYKLLQKLRVTGWVNHHLGNEGRC